MDRITLLAVLALAAVVGASAQSSLTAAAPGLSIPSGSAAAADPCGLGITFYPPQADNKPTGWTRAAQGNAGNPAEDQMLNIALAGYPLPQLYMAPVSVYTQVGGSVPLKCMGSAGADSGTLMKPAAFVIDWQLGAQGDKLGPFTKGSKQDPPANVTLNFVPQLPDGQYCLVVSLSLIPGTGVAVVGTQQVAVPATPQVIQRKVCFYKMATRPTANITFRSCNDSFAVDFTGVSPAPVLLDTTRMLFSTVFHVWGNLNRTFVANPPTDNLLTSFSQYTKWDNPQGPNFVRLSMDTPGLVEGYYTVNIEGSLATDVPDLVSLFGLDQYEDGSAKYMGQSLRNASNRPVPIQTVKSKIVDLAGPDTPISGQAQFTWTTQGYGEQFCYVDGQRISNSVDKLHCESPLTLGVTDNANHTLTVTITDVCGDTVSNGAYFGGWGWRPDLRYQPPAPPAAPADGGAAAPLPMPIGKGGNRTKTSAASTVSTSGLFMAAAAAFGALAALL